MTTLSRVTNAYMVISSPGYYELTVDIIDGDYTVGIYINASDVIFNGNDHLLDAVDNDSTYGIWIDNADNVTIKNIIKNTTDPDWGAIHASSSGNITIVGNKIIDNAQGIHLYNGNNGNITNNMLVNSNISIEDYSNVVVSKNNVAISELLG